MRKISPGTLQLGKPTEFDYFDAHGTLLLSRGHILQNQHQMDELIERGLFERIDDAAPIHGVQPATVPRLLNPFDLLDRCKSRLTALLNEIRIDDPSLKPAPPVIESLKTQYRASIAARCASPEARAAMPDGFSVRIIEIARVIQKTCRLDADAALGYVHLSPDGRYSILHPLHSAILAELLASQLGLAQEQRLPIIAAALTANISILNLQERMHQHEGELTPSLHDLLRLHPILSREMLIEVGVDDEDWLQAVLLHHERFDGSGYPHELAGDTIPVAARVVAMTDIYDAMIKPRGYRLPVTSKDALREIFLKRGGKVDESIARALVKELGVYPPGSFVRLHNGEIAIVFRRGKTGTTPLVRSVVGPRGAIFERPLRRDTAETHHVIVSNAPGDPAVRISFSRLWDYDKG